MRSAILMLLAVASFSAAAVTGDETPQTPEPTIRRKVPAREAGDYVRLTDWEMIEEGPYGATFVAPSTIRRNGTIATLWVLMDFKTPEAAKATLGEAALSALSGKLKLQFDCKLKLSSTLDETLYAGRVGTGDVVYVLTYVELWGAVPSGTAMESCWEIACGKQ